MSLSPLDRPAGSSQVLRYRGRVSWFIPGDVPTLVPLATFPKPNGIFPSNAPIVPVGPGVPAAFFVAYARFLLADPGAASPPLDPVALANPLRRLPSVVYDDSQPAGASPHSSIPSLNTPGINNGELILNPLTWAQNLEVHSSDVDENVLQADVGMAVAAGAATPDGSTGAFVLLDGTASGLGLNTGLPVVMVPFKVLADVSNPQVPALRTFFVDITFEIRHTPHR
jgi:hypothetical protein